MEIFSFLPEFLLFGSALYFWFLVVIIAIVLFSSEANENSLRAFISIGIFLVVTQLFSTFDILSFVTLKYVGIYFGIGAVYALIRTYIYGRKRAIEKSTKDFSGSYPTESGFDFDTRVRLKRNVFRWWFMFPISLLFWVFSDLLKELYNFVYDKVKGLFIQILKAGENSVKTK